MIPVRCVSVVKVAKPIRLFRCERPPGCQQVRSGFYEVGLAMRETVKRESPQAVHHRVQVRCARAVRFAACRCDGGGGLREPFREVVKVEPGAIERAPYRAHRRHHFAVMVRGEPGQKPPQPRPGFGGNISVHRSPPI